MSFLCKLHLDGAEYNVLHFHISLNQQTDQNDRPTAVARGGKLLLKLESTRTTEFFNWAFSDSLTKEGSVVFYRRDAMSKLREVRFKDAYCIDFSETFEATNTMPLTTEILLSAKVIDYGGKQISKDWPGLSNMSVSG